MYYNNKICAILFKVYNFIIETIGAELHQAQVLAVRPHQLDFLASATCLYSLCNLAAYYTYYLIAAKGRFKQQ